MLQALNTGHDGSMSTIHANGPVDALARLETLVLLADSGLPLAAVRAQVASSIDAVVFVARGQRRRAAGRGDRRGRRPPSPTARVRCSYAATRRLVPIARVTRPARRHDAAGGVGTEPAPEQVAIRRADPRARGRGATHVRGR